MTERKKFLIQLNRKYIFKLILIFEYEIKNKMIIFIKITVKRMC